MEMNSNSWQDLPQQPRWSKQRIRRRLFQVLTLGIFIMGGLGLCIFCFKKSAIQPLEHLKFSTNGTIQEAWFTSHIALPWHENLLAIDLRKLQAQILQYSQIQAVNITREYPSGLRIQLYERIPCAKMLLKISEKRKLGLVSTQGFIFFPIGYSKQKLQSLKTLSGVQSKFIHKQTILGFPAIYALFKFFQTHAPDLWQQSSSFDLKQFDPFVEKKWQTIDILVHKSWRLTFPLENPELALKKLQATLRALSRPQRQQLKNVDVSLSHPTVNFQ